MAGPEGKPTVPELRAMQQAAAPVQPPVPETNKPGPSEEDKRRGRALARWALDRDRFDTEQFSESRMRAGNLAVTRSDEQ